MRCVCGSDDLKVIDSRDSKERGTVRRRRLCASCGYRFSTYELTEAALLDFERAQRRLATLLDAIKAAA